MPALFPLRRYSMANIPGVTPIAPATDPYDPLQTGQRRRRRGLGGLFDGPARGILRREDGDPGTLLNYALFGLGGVETMRDRAQERELFPFAVRREKLEQGQIERELNAPPEAPERWSDLETIDGRLGQRNELTGQYDWAPQIPTGALPQPPSGYRFRPDGNLEAIQGGPADVRQTAEGRSRMQQMDSSARQLENAISVLDDAVGDVSGSTAGLFADTTRDWGLNQGSTDLNEALEPVRAILSFESLAEMRRNSATGGALGSIAVRELELLGNTVRSLSVRQSPQQLRRNIQATRAQLQRTLSAIQAARAEMDQGPNEAPAEPYVQEAPTNDGSAPAQPRVRRWNPATGRLE